MKKRLISILLISFVLTPGFSFAKEGKDERIATSLSLLIPGGGQIYNEQYVKGAIIGLIEGGTIYMIYKNNKYLQTEQSEEKRLITENNRNSLIWLLSAEIVYSSIDAFISAKMYDMNRKIDIGIRGNGVYIAFKFR